MISAARQPQPENVERALLIDDREAFLGLDLTRLPAYREAV
jgi:hypothetical protein